MQSNYDAITGKMSWSLPCPKDVRSFSDKKETLGRRVNRRSNNLHSDYRRPQNRLDNHREPRQMVVENRWYNRHENRVGANTRPNQSRGRSRSVDRMDVRSVSTASKSSGSRRNREQTNVRREQHRARNMSGNRMVGRPESELNEGLNQRGMRERTNVRPSSISNENYSRSGNGRGGNVSSGGRQINSDPELASRSRRAKEGNSVDTTGTKSLRNKLRRLKQKLKKSQSVNAANREKKPETNGEQKSDVEVGDETVEDNDESGVAKKGDDRKLSDEVRTEVRETQMQLGH